MKILLVLFASVFALLLGGCAEQPLMSDEEYNATKGPAPFSPDYSSVLPQPTNRPPGW
jgi:outer membrane lipoprotein SlyB